MESLLLRRIAKGRLYSLNRAYSIPLSNVLKVTKYNAIGRSLSTKTENEGVFGSLFGPESNVARPDFNNRWLMVTKYQMYSSHCISATLIL